MTFQIRRYRTSITLCCLVVILFFANVSIHSKNQTDLEKLQNKHVEPDFSITKELRMLRLAFLKWRACMRELLQDNNISLDDMDPEDPQYSYLQWLVSEAEKKNKEEESNTGELFDSLWHKLGSYTDKCRSSTDLWHMEPEIVSGTALKFFTPNPTDTSATFVRVGIGANVSIEQYFKKKLSADSEFFGADPAFMENSQIYSSIGTFFPFAVGNETGLKQATLKFSVERMSSKFVNHIGIDIFFKNLIRKDIIDYLIFEGDGGEYDMMSHLARNGTLEQAGISVCQINIEYHLPKEMNDPRKEIFRQHILQFIRDKKYTLHSVTNMGNLRVFWVNTSSLECARRYLEKTFLNDIDLV